MRTEAEPPTATEGERPDGDAESGRPRRPDGKRWVLGGTAPSRGADRRGNSGP